MNTFVTNAIVGTGQQRPETITTGTSLDGLLEHLPSDDIERKLLLAAGAWSLYRQAGSSTAHLAIDLDVAHNETLAACSSTIADLIVTMLDREYANLLPEALDHLQRAGQRLPYTLLPEVLDYGSHRKDMQAALVPVLGERGRWLSRYNPQWSWVAQFLNEHNDTLPSDAETVWQEGTLEQRKDILRLLRAAEPKRAREWLMDVWKKERGEARQILLDTFAAGLSAEDEAFLEIAYNDKSEHVQRIARSLLVRIPTSALSRSILALIDPLISYSHEKSTSSKKMMLTVDVPTTISPEWERLGLGKEPAFSQMSDEQWYLQQAIALIAPQHWEERFAVSVDDLLAATQYIDEQVTLVDAWTSAALLHNASHWYAPLCKWWLSQNANGWSQALRDRRSTVLSSLFQLLSSSDAERILWPLLSSDVSDWAYLFRSMPTPCSHELGLASLILLQQYVDAHKTDLHYDYNWPSIIPHIAKILPLSCFEHTNTFKLLADKDSLTNNQLCKLLPPFIKQIELRKKLLEELG